jgi:phytoene dehydrogenase-like protein
MSGKGIAIIGAGIPGGLCTSWKRGDCTFDGCIDWMTGSAPDGMMHPLWKEVGAIQDNTFLYEQGYCRYVGRGGSELALHLDVDRLEEELIRYALEDAAGIGELCGLIRSLKGFRPNVAKAMEVMGPLDYVKMMVEVLTHYSQYGPFPKYGKMSMAQFADKLKNAELREMLRSIWDDRVPGGIPNALKTGRDVVQMICRKEGKAFRTSVPA